MNEQETFGIPESSIAEAARCRKREIESMRFEHGVGAIGSSRPTIETRTDGTPDTSSSKSLTNFSDHNGRDQAEDYKRGNQNQNCNDVGMSWPSDQGERCIESRNIVAGKASAANASLATDSKPKKTKKKRKQVDFLKDKPTEMTYGRRIALRLMDKPWYNPQARQRRAHTFRQMSGRSIRTTETHSEGSMKLKRKPSVDNSFCESRSSFFEIDPNKIEAEQPSLEKAWAYFEHVALTRFIADRRRPFDGINLERALPGEKNFKTRLYDPIYTPHNQLGDFGLGVGLYFSTLRAIAVMALVAGFMNIPNMAYFASDEYMAAEFRGKVPFRFRGSAICTDHSWVPCPDCDCNNPKVWEPDRCAFANIGTQNLTFALRNNCEGAVKRVFLVNYATIILVLCFTLGLGLYLRRQEIAFDEDEQTARDYSIVVTNAPRDAHDPEEWREFFEENFDGAKVAVCTCAVDNDVLVKTLAERREKWEQLKLLLEPGTNMECLNLAYIAAQKERDRRGFAHLLPHVIPGVPEIHARLLALNGKVQGMAQLDYPVKNVFVTFETERDQRLVLSKLSVGTRVAALNEMEALEDPKYLFRGERVLRVGIPEEPDSIRWKDLNSRYIERVKEKLLTIGCTIVAIAVVAIIVWFADKISIYGATATISCFNVGFPEFAKLLTKLESHKSEGLKQTSLYMKIAIFRWVNTAIVISLLTPFTNTLASENGLISQVDALFVSEILTTNLIQLSDVWGHFRRHVLGPRAKTQHAMNLNFTGEEFQLAERYTNMTKTLFLTLWYCSIYPAAFFLCSFSLLVNYYVDRFSLMRSWRRSPQVSTTVSKFSRTYFFTLALLAMVVMSSVYFAGYPYDNLCANDTIDSQFVGTFTVQPNDGREAMEVFVSPDSVDYRYCLQNPWIRGTQSSSLYVPSKLKEAPEWMTEEQEWIRNVFSKTSIGEIVIIILAIFYTLYQQFRRLYCKIDMALGEDQCIKFCDVPSISAYIPQVNSRTFSYPLIACDVNHIDTTLFDWNDPDQPHTYYDLTKDAIELVDHMDLSSKNVFSVVKHWSSKNEQV